MPQENKNGAGAEAGKEKELDTTSDGSTTATAGEGAGEGNADGAEGDEEVTVKKSEIERLKADNTNYKKALGIGEFKKPKEEKKVETSTATVDTSKFVTKDDQYKANQKTAIKIATTVGKDDDAETAKIKKDLDENWEEVKAFYTGRRGKDSPDDIVEDLFDAHAVWSRNKKTSKNSGKEATADLATDKGTSGKSPQNAQAARSRVIPKNTNPADWYKKKS